MADSKGFQIFVIRFSGGKQSGFQTGAGAKSAPFELFSLSNFYLFGKSGPNVSVLGADCSLKYFWKLKL